MSATQNNYRYERKFFISDLTEYEVEANVKLNPLMFSEIYYQRYVNSMYFDSPRLDNFFDSISGSTNRIKVRIRWYGDLFGHIEQPVLEIKIKNGPLSRKEAFLLQPFKFNSNFNVNAILRVIHDSNALEIVKKKVGSLTPFLLSRYKRKYYQSFNKQYRITIDTKQIFYRVCNHNNSFLNKFVDDINVILELKYDQKFDTDAKHVINFFPFRLTKSSKYIDGIEKIFQIYY